MSPAVRNLRTNKSSFEIVCNVRSGVRYMRCERYELSIDNGLESRCDAIRSERVCVGAVELCANCLYRH